MTNPFLQDILSVLNNPGSAERLALAVKAHKLYLKHSSEPTKSSHMRPLPGKFLQLHTQLGF